MGHAKNVANFEELIGYCTGYGAAYNPSLNAIKLAQLNALKATANSVLLNVNTTYMSYKNATNNREVIFLPVKKLATRIVNALKASGVSTQTLNDAKTINAKIQGKRRGKLTKVDAGIAADAIDPNNNPVEAADNSVSVSQQSYDSMIEHFGKLIDLLTSVTPYNPNETDLKLSALNPLLANLKNVNTAVITATVNLSNTRIARNDVLYKAITGLVYTADAVKSYVKSLYGATSAQYKQLSGLEFRKIQ
jgi:hypothetical protein